MAGIRKQRSLDERGPRLEKQAFAVVIQRTTNKNQRLLQLSLKTAFFNADRYSESRHVLPAIHFNNLPRHIPRQLIRSQIQESAAAFIRVADAAHRNRLAEGFQLIRCSEALLERRHD